MPLLGVFALIACVAILVTVAVRATKAWWLYRGARVVECPENHARAGVSVAALHAAAGSVLGSPKLDLKACSRWPERADCGRECLAQIQTAPEDCLVRTILV